MNLHEPFTAFGWRLHRTQLAAGESLVFDVPQNAPRQDAQNLNYYSAGALQIVGMDKTGSVRRAGEFSAHRGPLVAGSYTATAIEDTEYWCINHTINLKRHPVCTPLFLAAGQSQIASGLLLLCRGSLVADGQAVHSGPVALEFFTPKTTTAQTDCYGLFFEGHG